MPTSPLWHGWPNTSKEADPDIVLTVAAEVQVVTLLVAYGTRESASFNLGGSLLEDPLSHSLKIAPRCNEVSRLEIIRLFLCWYGVNPRF